MFVSGELPIEKMQQMMDLNERWEANEAKKKYNIAMADFRLRCPSITKDSTVDFSTPKGRTNYKHASLHGTMNVIKDLLGDLGLNPSWKIDDTEPAMIRVTCHITHRDGHTEQTSMAGPPDSSGNKNVLQARASTVSYLERYTLFAILGLAAGEDNDGGGGKPSVEKPTLEPYSQKRFKEKYPEWKKSVEDADFTPDQIITSLQNKAILSASQLKDLRGLKDCVPVQP